MIEGSLAFYKKFRRHERRKKEEPQKDDCTRRKILVVDPSYELFHHQQTIHDQYHHECPSPDCAICSSNGSLRPANSVASRFSGSSSTRRSGTGRLSYTPSIASSYSGYGATYSSPDSESHSPFEFRASDTFSSFSPADERSYSRSTTDLHRPTSPWVPRLTTQRNSSVTELETPPSYDFAVSTSPRSSRPCDFAPRATLDAPFSTSDPLEAFAKLSSCDEDNQQSPSMRTSSISSWSTTSPSEPRSPTDHLAGHNHTHHNSLEPIAESELHDNGMGHRDDLIKQGFLL